MFMNLFSLCYNLMTSLLAICIVFFFYIYTILMEFLVFAGNLLKHHLLTHCHPIPVSCYGILQPLLSQPPPLTLPSSPHPPSRQESPPIAPPQSPPATSSPRNVQLKTVFVSYSREEVTCIEHLFLTSDWSYVTWVCTLYQASLLI